MLREQRDGAHRAEEVMEIERGLLEMYRDPSLDRKPKLLEERGGAFYSEAAAMLIESLYTDRGDDAGRERAQRGRDPRTSPTTTSWRSRPGSTRDGAQPLPTGAARARDARRSSSTPRPTSVLAIEAALSGDDAVALRALLANPLVPGAAAAAGLRDALIEANLPYLPRFATTGHGSVS